MQDIWQMMQNMKCGQKGQLALRFKMFYMKFGGDAITRKCLWTY